MEADVKRRVFNEGGATEGDIGPYTDPAYKKKRKKAGRRIDKKNLQFYGDERRNIQTGIRDDGAVLGFILTRYKMIAGRQVKFAGKQIFRPNKAEIKRAESAFIRYYRRHAGK